MKLPAVIRSNRFWFVAFVVWFSVLWFLSSGPMPSPPGPEIPHIDKVMHFGYYFGGAGILSAALFLHRRNPRLGWDVIHLVTIALVTATGVLDEWHQSWYEFRSGNDSADLAADFFGALAGTLVFRRLRHFVE
jgi:VanZ family protein